MSVLDASAVVELLLGTALGRRVAERLGDPTVALHVPHLLDVEVAQALRRYARVGEIDDAAATTALDDLRALDLERHPHDALLDRVWALRHTLTAYDAVYVALAEALDTIVVTCDAKLARAPGQARRVELVR